MTSVRVAELWARLMTDVLGYGRYSAAGGHFGAREKPELFAEDLRAFFRPLRSP